MKIELPDIPYELLDTLSGPEVRLVEAYARQAIREFVGGLPIAAWQVEFEQQNGNTETMWLPTHKLALNFADRGDPIPLIIKPELDDA